MDAADVADWNGYQGGFLTTGQEVFHRHLASNTTSTTMANQVLRLSFFVARKTETSTQVRVLSGGTAAGATPTLARIGLYTIASNGDGTLAASITSDTTLFAGTNTAYTRSWSSSIGMVAGNRYALGILVVTGATAPTVLSTIIGVPSESGVAPILGGTISAQTDLPASFLSGGVSASSSCPYGVILP
jgi:hypothetical protein